MPLEIGGDFQGHILLVIDMHAGVLINIAAKGKGGCASYLVL